MQHGNFLFCPVYLVFPMPLRLNNQAPLSLEWGIFFYYFAKKKKKMFSVALTKVSSLLIHLLLIRFGVYFIPYFLHVMFIVVGFGLDLMFS